MVVSVVVTHSAHRAVSDNSANCPVVYMCVDDLLVGRNEKPNTLIEHCGD